MQRTLIAVFFFFFSISGFAQEVRVCLEPFPPLINEDGTGLLLDVFAEMEKHSDLQFEIILVPYNRAKYMLRSGDADVIGMIPKYHETDEFYLYAESLEWELATKADLFMLSPDLLNESQLKRVTIGVPFGNADFFAEVMGLPATHFIENSLPSLVAMLESGRVDTVLFERVATRSVLAQQQVGKVYFQEKFTIPASLAVRRDESGKKLKTRLDTLFSDSELDEILSVYRTVAEETGGVLNEFESLSHTELEKAESEK